jgi:hypothetical protein
MVMAIQRSAADTHVILTALHVYREQEMEDGADAEQIQRIEKLIKSYRRSFKALANLECI